MTTAIRWDAESQRAVAPGISAAVRTGAALSAAVYHLGRDAHVPAHSHPNEEFGQILDGSLSLRVGGDTTELVAGEGFLVPGNVTHEADAGRDGCILLECYAPPRDPFGRAPQSGRASGSGDEEGGGHDDGATVDS